jgi:hypothetical protein
MNLSGLEGFVRESNHIENLDREPFSTELEAHESLLALERLGIADLREFVTRIGGGELRERVGMDVRVGNYYPPRGGPWMVERLADLLVFMERNLDSPWAHHVEYETVHPFMDGNGRSGRALWAWQTLHHNVWPGTLEMGFLHPVYYAALGASR